MRMAVGVVLESVGFTHCMKIPLDLLTDIGATFMKNLSERVKRTAEHSQFRFLVSCSRVSESGKEYLYGS